MDQHLLPILTFRCCMWPFCSTVAQEIDAFQAKLLAPLLDVTMASGEDVGEFCRRRRRRAGTLCDDHGRWSWVWADRVIKFDGHVQRNTAGNLWPALLRPLRDSDWLMQRRAQFVPCTTSRLRSWTALAGRTDTRYGGGGVALRWHDGVDQARSYATEARLRHVLKRQAKRNKKLRRR